MHTLHVLDFLWFIGI